ncbi:hypothetical protein FK535_09225 [Mycolicibacterium sp. 018/SC-01/001]|uniref:hypothetical protein n=1 Tax=Mycolicibacterium sp. 018/SC-01/001 TaxID=2592069 RepID=UPI00117F13F6|nr:hypothetical protein [Mycolicibacterium sp. 018/SC-01/001]TRW85567.1 hypothetical protein FK535_09225 [Mycolicibacterium sp. 018/SC-01/001]
MTTPEHICGWTLPSGRAIRPSECAACVPAKPYDPPISIVMDRQATMHKAHQANGSVIEFDPPFTASPGESITPFGDLIRVYDTDGAVRLEYQRRGDKYVPVG